MSILCLFFYLAAIECQDCSVGLYITDDKTDEQHNSLSDCKTCPTGKEFFDITECKICGAGQYQNVSDEENVSCKSCTVGRFLEDLGTKDTEHVSVEQCLQCPKGYEIHGTDITKCFICEYSKVSFFCLL